MAELVNSVRIDFSSLRLYGRDKEKKRLEDILQRTQKGGLKGTQVVEIKGLAGCGKSVLAETLKAKVLELGGFYVSEKYDKAQSLSQSYAVRQAIDDLFHELLKDDAIRTEIKASLMRELSYDDIAMLSAVLPDLPDFLEVDLNSEGNLSNDETSCRPEWIYERIKITICRFLQIVCDPMRPVIIVIEDIQWSDPAGLELLQSIAFMKDIKGLILVFPYRDYEVLVVEDHPVTRMLVEIRKHISPTSCHTMTVGDLKFAHIAQLLADLSYRRPEELFALAGILRARTHGNPFFLLQYLKLLERDQLIRRSSEGMGWTWSEQDIMRNLNVTDNVAAFVSDNIMKLPPSTRQTLQVASCFGAHFDITLLSQAMKGADVSEAIKLAIQDGLVEKITPLLYKFSHDRIHRAAYEFASPKEREALHYSIGCMVKELMTESSANDAIFIVADQLNKGRKLIQTTDEKLELAALNLEAAQKAKENSAFYPAAEYLNVGVSMIDETERWTKANYSLSLGLYTLLVEMERSVGHCDACYKAVAQIGLHGRSLDDKVPSLLLQIDALGSEGDAVRAIKEATDLLRQLGERFPRNPSKVSIAAEFTRTKIMLRGRSDENLANLPLIVGSMNVVMELLAMICSFAFHAGMTDHYSMAGFRMMKLSLKHGLHSPFVFAVYGVLSGAVALQTGYMPQYREASRFGELAIKCLPRFGQSARCRTLIVVTLFSMHLKRPYNHCLDHALEAYKSGMQVGDSNFSFCSTSAYLYLYMCAGLPLRALLKDCPLYASQMSEYGSTTYFQHASVLHQFVLNLTGESQRTTELSGDAMNLQEYLAACPLRVVEHIRIFQMCLGFYFDDIDQAREAADILWKVPRDEETFIGIWYFRRMYQGLVFVRLARDTGKRKYRKRSRYMMRLLEKFVRGGNINCLHCLLLLKAEQMSSNKKADPDVVRKAYDNAIVSAGRGGFTHTSAVAHELAFKYFDAQGDKDWATYYLTNACLRYREWNAFAKIRSLEQLHPESVSCEMPLDRRSVHSGNYRGQARFNSRQSFIHRGQNIRLISDSISMGNSGVSSVDSCVSSVDSGFGSSAEFALDDVSEGNETT